MTYLKMDDMTIDVTKAAMELPKSKRDQSTTYSLYSVLARVREWKPCTFLAAPDQTSPDQNLYVSVEYASEYLLDIDRY